nr:hypothetical protein Q903MT_gene5170 [Picea sitchensis]
MPGHPSKYFYWADNPYLTSYYGWAGLVNLLSYYGLVIPTAANLYESNSQTAP